MAEYEYEYILYDIEKLIYIIQEELTLQRQLIRLFMRKTVKNLFVFGTKLGLAFHSKVRFAFKCKCSGYAFKYGLKCI